jgi:hypothetical protein
VLGEPKIGQLDAVLVMRLAVFRRSTLQLALATMKARGRVLAVRQASVYGFTAKFPIVFSGLLIVACSILAHIPGLKLTEITLPESIMDMIRNPPAPLQIVHVALALSFLLAVLIPAQVVRTNATERAQLYADLLEAALTYQQAASAERVSDPHSTPIVHRASAANLVHAEPSYALRENLASEESAMRLQHGATK